MGNLTNDMTRLRGEVDVLRSERAALRQELSRGARDLAVTVSAMQADFAAARVAMAKQTRDKREAFMAAVIAEVNSMLSLFSRDRGAMARKGRDNRRKFLAEMRREVANIRKGTADDLMGARAAWQGHVSRKSQTVQLKMQPEIVTPPPQEEENLKKTDVVPEFKPEKPLGTFRDEFKAEGKMNAVTSPEAPLAEPLKVQTPPPVFAAPDVPKQKEKSRLVAPTVKVAPKGKRGKK